MQELKRFISLKLLKTDIKQIESHADYIIVKRLDDTVKSITIEQIRSLQKFLNKTSVITGNKVAVIFHADQININAANACLKLLEDTPSNSFIFLLAKNVVNVIPTIRSRCARIDYNYNSQNINDIDADFVIPLLKKTSIVEKIKFMNQFASKNRVLWQSFATKAQELIAKLCKRVAKLNCILSEQELELLTQLKSRDPEYLQIKYDQIIRIIEDTNNFDLDRRCSVALLMDKFKT